MNIPRKKRRWSSEIVGPLWQGKVRPGVVMLGIHDQEAATVFAALVSEFVHLETAMGFVLSQLLGSNSNIASHISKQILSPAVRIGMMRALLERAPYNKDKPDCFDEIIAEFQELNTLRNQYVHGRWETCDSTGQLYLARPNDDPFALGSLVTEKFDFAEMLSAKKRIMDLWTRIHNEIGVESPIEHQR